VIDAATTQLNMDSLATHGMRSMDLGVVEGLGRGGENFIPIPTIFDLKQRSQWQGWRYRVVSPIVMIHIGKVKEDRVEDHQRIMAQGRQCSGNHGQRRDEKTLG
jgi:hypothetical protein